MHSLRFSLHVPFNYSRSVLRVRTMATVQISEGCSLKGRQFSLRKHPQVARPIEAFLGIPYAQPPRRFEPPESFLPWSGTRDATKFGPICPQDTLKLMNSPFPVNIPKVQSEDCLYLNVWTPKLGNANLPVMFFIHGGAYTEGFSNLYQGTSLCTFEDVVFVSINYRLGPFGFLCTGDSASTGNYGLLDQIQALKWVNTYIRHFGGDPGNITIFGESAGGMSVSNLVLSPLTKGMFRRAISESGVATSGSFLWSPERAKKYLSKQLPNLGCEAASSKEIVNFLKTVPADELRTGLGEGFRPVIDGYVVTDRPQNMYASARHNHVDYMLGCNSHEGAMFVFGAQMIFKTEDKASARIFARGFVRNSFRQNVDKITDMVMAEYLPSENPIKTDILKGLVALLNDLTFYISSQEFAKMHSKTCNTYVYHFDHRPQLSPYPDWVRADHAMEILYIFGTLFVDLPGFTIDESELQLCKNMMRHWANFARTGNPSSETLAWPKYTESEEEYMLLGTKAQVKKGLPYRTQFWQNIISKYGDDATPQAKY